MEYDNSPKATPPAGKSRKERDQERKRNEILDAAEKLFFSKGYEETSINEIAQEAEFAKGTIYLYFSGKSEIYLAIVNRSMDIIREMIAVNEHKAKTGAEKLKLGCDTFADFFSKYPDYFNMWLQSPHFVEPEVYMNHPLGKECQLKEKQLMEMSIASIMQGLQDGSIKSSENPMMIAVAVTVFNRGLYQFMLDDKGRMLKMFGLDSGKFIEFMQNILFNGLNVKKS